MKTELSIEGMPDEKTAEFVRRPETGNEGRQRDDNLVGSDQRSKSDLQKMPQGRQGRPLRVLIVEDNPHDVELVLRELRRAGFEPDWDHVDTEAAFLALLEAGFDVILSDYTMPDFDGMQAMQLLKERGLDIPFIIVSGAIGEDVAVRAVRNGAADYLIKGRITRLGTAVEHVLKQAELRKERKQAEQKLRASEARYRRIFETARDGILIICPTTQRVTDVNPSVSRLLGYSYDEILDRQLWEIGLLQDENANQSVFRELQEKNFIRYEHLQIVSRGGERQDVEFVASFCDEAEEKVVQCNIFPRT